EEAGELPNEPTGDGHRERTLDALEPGYALAFEYLTNVQRPFGIQPGRARRNKISRFCLRASANPGNDRITRIKNRHPMLQLPDVAVAFVIDHQINGLLESTQLGDVLTIKTEHLDAVVLPVAYIDYRLTTSLDHPCSMDQVELTR